MSSWQYLVPYYSEVWLFRVGLKLTIMRKCTVALMLVGAGLLLNISLAQGQGNLSRKNISVPQGHMSLMDIFREIQMQAGFMFVFQPTLVDQFEHLPVPGGTHTVQEFLETVLHDTPVGFEENGRNIIIFRRPITFTIRGRVVDAETEEGLPGVTIYIKDSNKGTHSDPDGSFVINATKEDVLVFSYVGRITKQVTVNEHTPRKIMLQPMTLPEVMVNTGYYTVTEPERIGNISTVTREQLERSPVVNSLSSIQGRLAGVFVEQISGLHGSGYKIRIRGQNSLRDDGNEPLYIIDGVPYPSASMVYANTGYMLPLSNSLSLVPLSTIDKIDVLKDADATAIYGSRGANGVILISTKRPAKKGSGSGAEVDINTGFSQVGHYVDLLNTPQWRQMRREAHKNDGVEMTDGNSPDIRVWDSTRYTNWQKELIGAVAPVTNAVVSLYGGEGNTKFLFSGNFYKEGSVFPKRFDYTRSAGLFNMTHQSKDDRFHVNIIFNYSADDNNLPMVDITQQAFSLAPTAPSLYDSAGQINWANNTWYNPLAYLEYTYRAQTSNLSAHAMMDYNIAPGLLLKTNLGQATLTRKETVILPRRSYSPAIRDFQTGQHYQSNNTLKTFIAEPILEYSHELWRGQLTALVGTTIQHMVQEAQSTTGSGYLNDAFINDLGAAPTLEASDPVELEYRYAAAFGRLNYNWREKYILNATVRRDGSSRFGVGKKFANFGSVGGAWIFTKEPFSDKISFLSFGKVRATYGITGNDQISNYGYYTGYEEVLPYGGSSVTPVQPNNALYSWESTRKAEIGIALGFFRNRIQADLSYYRNRSSNQLLTSQISTVSGFAQANLNLPIILQNSGFELLLSTTQLDGRHFSWTTNLNFTLPYNKLVRYDGLASSADSARYIIGESINSKRVYKYHVNPNTGLYSFRDLNGDQVVNRNDRYIINRGVHYFGGIDNTIRFRNFQLDILFQFVKQTSASYEANSGAPGARINNQPTSVLGRWQQPGDNSNNQRFTVSEQGINAFVNAINYSDMAYTNASYIRCKNIALTYNLNTSFTKRLAMQSAKVYIQAQNLFTLTHYVGVDPETIFPSNLPPLRTIVGGVHLTF
jgi:TonB-dependent starch-binding outer membrane protein SusC